MRDRQAEFPGLWHTFLQRKVLTVERPLGYVYGGVVAYQFQPLREFVTSLLYIDLVSLLEIAVRTQMSGHKFGELEDLEQRLGYLEGDGKLLDGAGLERLRRRRNEIAHAIVRVGWAELNAGIALVQAQLEAWRLVCPAPAYEFYAERSGARATSDDERSKGYFTDDELLGQALRERYMVPVAWGEQTDLIRTVLPAAFEGHLPPARPRSGPIPAPTIGISPAILEMVRSQEAERVEQLQREVEAARAALDQQGARLEEERRQVAREQQSLEEAGRLLQEQQGQLKDARRTFEQERRRLEVERARLETAQAMATATVPPSGRNRFSHPGLDDLRQRLQAHGITQDAVAAAAGVNRTMVCNVLAGRGTSRKVVEVAERLLGGIRTAASSGRVAQLSSRGHTYNDLARAAGVSFSMVEKWMKGRRSSARLEQAFEALVGVDPQQLRQRLARAGIMLREVAAEASRTSRRGHVSISSACKVLNGQTQSQNVIDAARRLLPARAATGGSRWPPASCG